MWRLIAPCMVFSGCGFESRPGAAGDDGSSPPDDAEVASDAATDAAKDAADTPNCFAQWRDGTVLLESPIELMKISFNGSNERDPWVSRDGLRLYFAKETFGVTPSDIYLATRTDVSKDFDNAAPLRGVNSDDEESGASLSPDEKLLALARGGLAGRFVVYLTVRNEDGVFESPSKDHLGNVNADDINHFDPFLTAAGKKLYLAPAPPPPGHQHIVATTRAANTEDFATPVDVEGIADGVNGDADPAVADDDHILVFSSSRPAGAGRAGTNLWYATRADVQKSFGTPALIPSVNSEFDDGDPMLSPNGCELYFSSRSEPDHGDYDLYVAKVSTRASPLPLQR